MLGSTYLKLVKMCGQSQAIPAIDPSLYITRFTQLLDFGDETQKVAQDAVRLVQRFDRDWMNTGRRPAGICGACCLLAARMNNFRRSVAEIVQVVKIADITIKKRLNEFKKTPTGDLTVQDFRSVWLDEAANPPAYEASLKKDKAAKRKAGKKRKRAEDEDDPEEHEEGEALDDEDLDAIDEFAKDVETQPEQLLDGVPLTDLGITAGDVDPDQELHATSKSKKGKGKAKAKQPTPEPRDPEDERLERDIVDPAITDEIEEYTQSKIGGRLLGEAEEQQRKRAEFAEENRLDNLDEEELDAFILTEEEAKEKERLWMEMNKEYLEHIAGEYRISFVLLQEPDILLPAKQRAAEGEDGVRKKPRVVSTNRLRLCDRANLYIQRKRTKPRDASNPSGATATEAATELLKKKKVSRKLNYAVLDGLFSVEDEKGRDNANTEKSSQTGPQFFEMDERAASPEDEFDSTARMVPIPEQPEEDAMDIDPEAGEPEEAEEPEVEEEAAEESEDDEAEEEAQQRDQEKRDQEEDELAKLMGRGAGDEEQFDLDADFD